RLGNILSSRDWGHARDYVQAMWLMLQQEKPKDYVVATGETHTVKEFLYKCFDKIGVDRKAAESLFVIDKDLYRPSEVDYLCGDSSLAQRELGWKPKTSFDKLIDEMLYE